MTWVIGMPGFLTRGVVVSDVRVSLVNTRTGLVVREVDAVQKIHQVAHNMVLGFAGSVELGFALVEDLRRFNQWVPAGNVASPAWTAWHWGRRVRFIWSRLPPAAQQLGCELLLAGALPGQGPIVHSSAFALRSPRFEFEQVPARTARSIGSGAHVAEYAAELVRFGEDWVDLVQADVMMGPLGPLVPMGLFLAQAIRARDADGISPHLHLCSVRPMEILLGTNDMQGFGDGAFDLEMPPVATTWAEYQALAHDQGFAALAAVAPAS
jgi:hypothetical protein